MNKKGLAAALEGAELLAAFTDTHGSAAYGALKKAVEMFLDADGEQPEWNGTGLPPVGCECELEEDTGFYSCQSHEVTELKAGSSVVIIGHAERLDNNAVCVTIMAKESLCAGFATINPDFVRPIRTEAEKRREADLSSVLELMNKLSGRSRGEIAEAILDAGFTRSGGGE